MEAHEAIRKIVGESIFGEFVTSIEEVDTASLLSHKENTPSNSLRRTMKITSSHTAVIAGLKTFLMEVAADLVTNLDDAIFNVEA